MNGPGNLGLPGYLIPANNDRPVNPTLNLRILSPTKGVPGCIDFKDLPTVTTILDLKNKIRERVQFKPLAKDQRLIWRGRALVSDHQTLADLFADDVRRDQQEPKTIHLVVRDLPESITAPPAAPAAPAPPPARSESPPPRLTQQRPESQANPWVNPSRVIHPNPIGEVEDNLRNRVASAREQHGGLVRAIVSSNQRSRAEAGLTGLGQTNQRDSATATGCEPANRAPSSGATQPSNQQATAGKNTPNVTASEAPTPQTGDAVPTFRERDVYRVIPGLERALDRGRDRGADSRTGGATSMQRSVSGASLGGRSFTQPGVTVPVLGGAGLSRPASGRATPVLSNPVPSQNTELFIVSSPEGPQYLLLNPAAHDTYYPHNGQQTLPNTSVYRLDPSWRTPGGVDGYTPNRDEILSRMDLYDPAEVFRYRPDLQARSDRQIRAALEAQRRFREYRQMQEAQAANQPQPQPQPAAPAQPAPNVLHPNNRVGAGIPALFVQFWPHIWSLFRIGIFVWFFTNPNSSWSQWIMVLSLAIAMFIFSGGWLNGVVHRVWQPFARHLDDLFPAIDRRHGVQRPGANGNQAGANNEAATTPQQGPNPTDMAARLVAERRDQHTWLGGQLRRLERAGLLFLASIAPGVAERHIANLEAEAQAAETRRREAEEAAAAAAAESEASTTTGEAPAGGADNSGEAGGATAASTTNDLSVDESAIATGVSDPSRQDGLRERNGPQ